MVFDKNITLVLQFISLCLRVVIIRVIQLCGLSINNIALLYENVFPHNSVNRKGYLFFSTANKEVKEII